jgi:hypothetical protein
MKMESAVALIGGASLLGAEGFNELSKIAQSLAKAHSTRQVFRTETEARVSVLGDIHFPTKAAKYWQCVREQASMLDNLAADAIQYRRNELAIKRAMKRMAECAGSLDAEEAAIDLDECKLKRESILLTGNDRLREILMWEMLKAENDDGSFDTENVNAHQLVSYATKFALTAATVTPEQFNSGEFINLADLLQTTLRRCADLGVVDQVKANLPPEVFNQLKLENSNATLPR